MLSLRGLPMGTGHLPAGAHHGFPKLCSHFQAEDPEKGFDPTHPSLGAGT